MIYISVCNNEQFLFYNHSKILSTPSKSSGKRKCDVRTFLQKKRVYGILKLQCHAIASQHGVHLVIWGFPVGNQIYGFGCPAFERGTTWNFFKLETLMNQQLSSKPLCLWLALGRNILRLLPINLNQKSFNCIIINLCQPFSIVVVQASIMLN